MFNLHSGHVVASLNKTLYDGYFCLVALNKKSIKVAGSQISIGMFGIRSTPKRVKIRPKQERHRAFL